MFAAFWGGGAGSEVLSTEEMRSKHSRTSLKPQGGKAGFRFSRTVGPGLGRKERGTISTIWQRRASLCLGHRGSQGPGTSPHLGSGENRITEPGWESQHSSSRGADLRPWPAACFQQCPATQLGTCLRSQEYTPSWGRSCECLLFQYVPFLQS